MLNFALALSALAAPAALGALLLVLRQGRALVRLQLLGEQALAGARAEAETTRATLRATDTAAAERITGLRGVFETAVEQVRTTLTREQGELRLALADSQQKAAAH